MKWTSDSIPDQHGKVAIITGANSGIGYAAAQALAAKNAKVVLASRNSKKGKAALERLMRAVPDAKAKLFILDLANLDSIEAFVEQFENQYDRLDILLNNAGVMGVPERRETIDGFEMHFGTNHLGHFALTGRLIDIIKETAGARVVTISSGMHIFGKINFDDLYSDKSYHPWNAYAQSKLANLLFAFELDRHFKDTGIDALSTAAHPGWAATNLQANVPGARQLNRLFAQNAQMGALPGLYAATALDVVGGEYFGPRRLMGMRGYPKLSQANKRAYDLASAARLWEVSESLTGVMYDAIWQPVQEWEEVPV